MIGRTLAHYRIIDHLGKGGMGEVYLAEDTRLKRKVALKILPSAFASDPSRLSRFQREAEAVAALNHPNIVTIHSIEEDDGVHFLTMQRVVGDPLDRLIPAEGLDARRFFELALQLVDAVAAAHDRGITHRDLKPANVMVSPDGRVCVLDFGLEKMRRGDAPQNADETTIEQTRQGALVGTVPYMSPEQVEGLPVDHRSDIFSLGIMFYVMLTGHRPFAGETTVALIWSILGHEPPDVRTIKPGLPEALGRAVARCLEKPPDARYQSARDLHRDLETTYRQSGTVPSWSPLGPSGTAGGARSRTALPLEQAVAVLPFQDMSSDHDNEYFGDGIAEEIINALARIDGLRVAARTSSFSFKGKSIEIGEIAKRLNVNHVLEGSVRKAGNHVRITAQLVDASRGYQLWSDRYDRQLEHIFDVQDDIARMIVERLKVSFAIGQADRLVKVATRNMEAYELYLKGCAMVYRGGVSIDRALASFTKAVTLDPDYAQAWAGLADACTTLAYGGFAPSNDILPRAVEAARRACEADPECAEAHSAVAGTALFWERDFQKAEREFLRALELNPTYTQARCWYALFFLQASAGRFDEGVKEARRAVNGDPLSSYALGCYSYALAGARRYDEAIVQSRLALQRDPGSFSSRWALAFACHWAGKFDEALAAWQALLSMSGRNVWALAGMSVTCAQMGKDDEARTLHRELLDRRMHQYVQPAMLAISASAIGDQEAALGFCREAVDQHDAVFAVLGLHDPALDRVRADPRFAEIIRAFNQRGAGDMAPGAHG